MKILITGCAGFIGAAVAQALLQQGHEIVGIDNLNDYYDVNLKQARLAQLIAAPQFCFYAKDIKDNAAITEIFKRHKPTHVVHLAAQAGVRYSLENPQAYVDSNLVGFVNLLEACRQHQIAHFVFASSSSVYGSNKELPYCVHHRTDQPVSLYAATKKSNELLAYSYSHLFNIPMTGLRYFTVYGPWGRPDMAPFKFVEKIIRGESIPIYNAGQHQRDFTFIDDIVAGTLAALKHIPQTENMPPYKIYNIACGQTVKLFDFIALLEKSLNRQAMYEMLPKQPGDVDATWADISELQRDTGYRSTISLEEGIPKFVDWYLNFYKLKCRVD